MFIWADPYLMHQFVSAQQALPTIGVSRMNTGGYKETCCPGSRIVHRVTWFWISHAHHCLNKCTWSEVLTSSVPGFLSVAIYQAFVDITDAAGLDLSPVNRINTAN